MVKGVRQWRPPPDARVMLLLDLIDEHPDLTVEEIRTWLQTRRTRATNDSARHRTSSKKPRTHRSVAKKQNVLLFGLESRASALHAAYCGLVAAFIVLGFSIYQVFKAITESGIDPLRSWTVFAAILSVLGLQCVVVIGLYYYSRIAAVGSFVIFATQVLAVYWIGGFQSPTVSIAVIVLLLAFTAIDTVGD
jgi:hypothetical protein